MILPIALILVGLVLIAVEVYAVPGINVVGIAGGLSIVGGVVLAFVEGGAIGGLIAAVGSISVAGAMFYVMWQSGALQHFVLLDSLVRETSEHDRDGEHRSRYLGRVGEAVTPLRPAGIVEIGGERIEVQTEGGFIASGSRVKVVAMDRQRFFVRLEAETAPSPTSGEAL